MAIASSSDTTKLSLQSSFVAIRSDFQNDRKSLSSGGGGRRVIRGPGTFDPETVVTGACYIFYGISHILYSIYIYTHTCTYIHI